jgi:hypothetical protein
MGAPYRIGAVRTRDGAEQDSDHTIGRRETRRAMDARDVFGGNRFEMRGSSPVKAGARLE